MTTPSSARRGPFSRDPSDRRRVTDASAPFLVPLAASRFATAEQLAALAGRPESSARNHLGKLYHKGRVARVTDALPIPYALNAEGARWLLSLGLVEELPAVPEAGRKSLRAVPHDLAVTGVRVWAVRVARAAGGGEVSWREGKAHWPSSATPDATVSFAVGTRTFAAYVEADMGTEDAADWRGKSEKYARQLAEDGQGGPGVLVATVSATARDRIARWLEAGPCPPGRFRVCGPDALAAGDLSYAGWRRPGEEGLRALA